MVKPLSSSQYRITASLLKWWCVCC